MREFKFRVWDSHYKLWDMEVFLNSKGEICDDTIYGCQQSYRREYYTLQQFTGLRDKSGKEIYDGDIVAINFTHDPHTEYHVVGIFRISFGDYGWMASNDTHSYKASTYQIYAEVIGNIFENPDLL